jgi:hypothetical protein
MKMKADTEIGVHRFTVHDLNHADRMVKVALATGKIVDFSRKPNQTLERYDLNFRRWKKWEPIALFCLCANDVVSEYLERLTAH